MLKTATFFAGCLPLAYSLYQAYLLQSGMPNSLGADPGKALVLLQGEWALRFLLLTLLVTPVRQLTPWTGVIRIRRMLGLFAFFYASLHLAAYMQFLLLNNLADILADIGKRPYITVGFAALALMLPMALTSTNSMMKRLKRHWKTLHSLIYAVAVLAVIHIVWLARSSYAEAIAYGAIVFLLLFYRVWQARSRLKNRLSGLTQFFIPERA